MEAERELDITLEFIEINWVANELTGFISNLMAITCLMFANQGFCTNDPIEGIVNFIVPGAT